MKALLEPACTGMVAAIEVNSGDYFVAADMGEAVEKAEAKYPDELFYIVKIGFPTAVSFKNRTHL